MRITLKSMHICRLIRISRKGATVKAEKKSRIFCTLPNVGILKASQIPQSDLLLQARASKEIRRFSETLEMCFEPLKIIVTCLLACFCESFSTFTPFFEKFVLHSTKHWQLNLLLKNLSRKSELRVHTVRQSQIVSKNSIFRKK